MSEINAEIARLIGWKWRLGGPSKCRFLCPPDTDNAITKGLQVCRYCQFSVAEWDRKEMPTERCEWNPDNCEPASDSNGCTNETVFSVGTGAKNFHLCAECAALPFFKKYKKIELPQKGAGAIRSIGRSRDALVALRETTGGTEKA